jgi:uncharacterized protein YecE (DUF72 family)
MKPADYLNYYAQQFNTVEIDSTWYGPPTERTVRNWHARTPEDFVISAKVPQIITHERCLEGCEEEMHSFLKVMEVLGPKLGVLLFQFPYFNQQTFPTGEPFLALLERFLKQLPAGFEFAVEVRNKTWITPKFRDLLAGHKVAMAMIDHPWMPTPNELVNSEQDLLTTDFAYVRLLGDRYAIEEKTKTWEKEVVDRTQELQDWTTACEQIIRRGKNVFVYINNHFSGHAPATVVKFLQVWNKLSKAKEAGTVSLGDQQFR